MFTSTITSLYGGTGGSPYWASTTASSTAGWLMYDDFATPPAPAPMAYAQPIPGMVVGNLLDGLKSVRGMIAQGWARDRGSAHMPRGGTAYCINGAIHYGTAQVIPGLVTDALIRALPKGFAPPKAGTVVLKGFAPDDTGQTYGTSRGSAPGCNCATFNNLAANKQVVLDWIDRAIAAEQDAKFIIDLKAAITGPVIEDEVTESA